MKAVWNNHVIAHSAEGYMVEGNAYFPPESVRREFLKDSPTHSTCHWKGDASYYTIEAGGQSNQDAAWTYRDPKPAASTIKNYVAFWRGVEVVPESDDQFAKMEPDGARVC
ncbi:DUF427 domain-containing protein [Candidatus Berkelbacteria bacterium]|nr:DUF427 domain-containing protein [Candidatus Berkelbacteria bacterium]